LFVFKFYGQNLNAQGIAFQKTLGGNSFDFGVDLVELSNKDYCILSSSSSYTTSNDMLVWVIDSIGDYKHHFFIGQNDVEYSAAIRAVNDTLFILGTSLNQGSGNYDILFSSYKSDGTKLFEKRFDYANWELATSFSLASDGGFLLGGNTSIDGLNQSDGFLIKLDQHGDIVFYRSYGGLGNDSIGGVVEAGGSYFTIGTNSNVVTGDKDIWVLKIDSANGNILEEKFFGGIFDDFGQSILVNSFGDLIIGGVSNSYFNQGGNFNYYFQKCDQNLNLLWVNPQVSNNVFDWLSIRSMSLLPNDEILFFGTKYDLGNNDFMVYQLNNQGFFNGGTSFGTFGNEFGGKLIYTLDSGYVFCGTTEGFWAGLDNVFVQKNDTDFFQNQPFNPEVGIVKNTNSADGISLFPNPTNSVLFMEVIGDFSRFEIRNLGGQLIVEDFLNMNNNYSNQHFINTDDFPPGIYCSIFYGINNEVRSIQKFVVLDK
jgi:hypothetical protein